MKLLSPLATWLGSLLLITTPVLGDDEAELPDLESLKVVSTTWSGTGCPEGTVSLKETTPNPDLRT